MTNIPLMNTSKQNTLGVWMVIASLCCLVTSLSADNSGLLRYTDNGKSITITGCDHPEDGVVEIPATINGKPVENIETGEVTTKD